MIKTSAIASPQSRFTDTKLPVPGRGWGRVSEPTHRGGLFVSSRAYTWGCLDKSKPGGNPEHTKLRVLASPREDRRAAEGQGETDVSLNRWGLNVITRLASDEMVRFSAL